MAKQVILLVLLVLLIAAPAQALTWGDDFSANTSSGYTYYKTPTTNYWYWDTTNQILNSTPVENKNVTMPKTNFTPPYLFSVNFTPRLPYTSDLTMRMYAVALQDNFTHTLGNKYYFQTYRINSTGVKAAALFKTVAGSTTSIKSVYRPVDLDINTQYNLKIYFDPTVADKQIRIHVNDIEVINVTDTTFSTGNAGIYSRYGMYHYDNFFINESAVANIASCTMTAPTEVQCTQDGDNYDDPGVTSTWVWGDGATSAGAIGTHTYSAPGYYTVSLILTNVAGSSSDTCINCADVSALPWAQVISPSVDYHPDCPWWRFGIACDHLIKLTV